MRWFKHLTNAHDGMDLTKVRMKFGAEGYAVYWYCLELIAGDLGENGDVTFELKHDAEVIAFNLRMDSLRVEEIMRFMVSVGLFENSRGTISCLKLAKYLDKRFTRNNKIHEIIDASSRLRASEDGLQTVSPCLGLSEGEEMRRDEKREDKKREGERKRAKRAARRPWPDDLQLTPARAAYAIERGHDPEALWALFHDKALANSYVYADWDAAWRNWCRSERNHPKGSSNGTDRKLSAAERCRRDSAEYVRRTGDGWPQ